VHKNPFGEGSQKESFVLLLLKKELSTVILELGWRVFWFPPEYKAD
jgi:hypothetical protein